MATVGAEIGDVDSSEATAAAAALAAARRRIVRPALSVAAAGPVTGEFGVFSPPVTPGRSGGSIISAVAESAVETADEEQQQQQQWRRSSAGRSAVIESNSKADRDVAPAEGEVGGEGRGSRLGVAAVLPPLDDESFEEPLEVEPPSMQGASLPARLAVPQALLSPTSPPAAVDISSHLSSAMRSPRPMTVGGGSDGSGGGGPDDHRWRMSRVGVGAVPERVFDPSGEDGSFQLTLSPTAMTLSPGTDSDRGSVPSPEGYLGGGGLEGEEYAGVGRNFDEGKRRSGGGGGGGNGTTRRPPSEEYDLGRPSPWVATRGAVSSRAAGAAAVAAAAAAATTQRQDEIISASISDPHPGVVSPQSSSNTGSSLWRAHGGSRGGGSFSPWGASMGVTGADEMRGGLLAVRAEKMRALGALNLAQVSLLRLLDL